MYGRGDFATGTDDIDDHAALAFTHAANDRIDDIDVGKILGIHRVAPSGRSQFGGWCPFGGTGRCHQYINRAKDTLGSVNHRLRRIGVDEIASVYRQTPWRGCQRDLRGRQIGLRA